MVFVGQLKASKPYRVGMPVELHTADAWYILALPALVPDTIRENVNTSGYVRIEGELQTTPVSYVRTLHVDSIERAP